MEIPEEYKTMLYELRLQNVTDCFNRGDYKQMAEVAEQAVHLKPDSANAHYHLGNAYGLLNRFEGAEQELMKAVSLNPSDDRPFFALGLLYATLDRFDDAIKSFKEAIRLNPQYDGAYFYMGELYESVASIEVPSTESLQETRDEEGSNKLSKLLRPFAQSLDRFSLARKAYEEAIRINPHNAQAYHSLGRIKAYEFSQLGFGIEDAIDCYKKAVELDPNLSEAQADLEQLLVIQSQLIGGLS